ncbi:hypothetical protein D9Q98_008334 [Chlorella vulgaris]|uniref:Rieske domain-containing protein n=1 Tax=Chlorella vulgaris TaxID=3077 RepID=A0A9D4TGI0_CHLVU|nr:hypothetical protein D9Q98_008334 [Chlorella vulgaris]
MAGSTTLAKARGMQPARESAPAAFRSAGGAPASHRRGRSLWSTSGVTDVAEANNISVQTETATKGTQFSWTKCWYPVTAVSYLDPARPHQATILGHNLVVWRDSSNTWRCFKDSCPHRAAPLSEGRIHPITKDLECAYHGWQFEGSGAARELPQSEPGSAKATACASKRSCATSFPTAEAHGLLFVWLEGGAEGQAQAAAAPLPSLPAADHTGKEWFPVSTWYVRDLEVDYLPLMENSADPGHVHFTHAGYIGSPDKAGPITVRVLERDDQGVYRFVCDDPKGATFRNLDLQPPCMLWASSEGMAPEGELALLYFVVPVAPGRSRLMSLPLATNSKFRTLSKIFHWQPWLRHLYNHKVAAQDIVILHRQGTNMAAPDFDGWRRGFYLPTTADSGVVVLRKWLEDVAGGGVAWGPNVAAGGQAPIQPEERREVLMDHYHQHTEHCPHCRGALKNVQTASKLLLGTAGACFLGLAYAWGRGTAPLAAASLALLAGLGASLALRSALKGLEQQFIFTDWRHSDH